MEEHRGGGLAAGGPMKCRADQSDGPARLGHNQVRMQKRLLYLNCLLFSFLLLTGCRESAPTESSPSAASDASTEAEDRSPEGEPYAIIATDKGDITVRLLPDLAPETVARFIELSELAFYNRTSFHRVMEGRMIQGGDPLSRDSDPYNDGTGTSGAYLPQEFSQRPFERGSVAMGREAGSDNGGSCQFFIVLKRSPEWDGRYNLFGEVTEGIEIADGISEAPLTQDAHPSLKFRPAGKQIIEEIQIEYR